MKLSRATRRFYGSALSLLVMGVAIGSAENTAFAAPRDQLRVLAAPEPPIALPVNSRVPRYSDLRTTTSGSDAPSYSAPPSTSTCRKEFDGAACYNPLQLQKAYGISPLLSKGISGKGKTIAVLESFGSPTIRNDLSVFDKTYGIKDPPTLTTIAPVGVLPPFDPGDRQMFVWAGETTLDVEYAHAMAPDAKILVVATPIAETEGTTGMPEMMAAINYVADHGLADIVSMSFGATEGTFPDKKSILDLRPALQNAVNHHITLLAASGDTGVTNYEADENTLFATEAHSWPSTDPLVTSVGGTKLNLDDQGSRISPDVAWNDEHGGATGGGVSAVFGRPAYQDHVRAVVGSARGVPDISMSAASSGFVWFFETFDPETAGWQGAAGTSESTPLLAGVVALADQVAGRDLGNVNPILYGIGDRHGLGIIDVTQGNNSFAGVTGYSATVGFDLASGLGTVNVPTIVSVLATS